MPRVRKVHSGQIKGLSEKLVQFRLAHGLNQRDMAEKLRLPFRSLQDYEQGKATPGALALLTYKKFGASVDWLLDEAAVQPIANEFHSGSVRLNRSTTSSTKEFIEIPLCTAPPAASGGTGSGSDQNQKIVLPTWLIPRDGAAQADLRAFTNTDDAMAPLIPLGALVVGAFGDLQLDRPGLYAMRSGTGLGVRKVIARSDGQLTIQNINEQWPAERISSAKAKAKARIVFWLANP